MPDLKVDLNNKLQNDKYYHELELVRLAQEPNMNYSKKIKLMIKKMSKITLINSQLSELVKYFSTDTNIPNNQQSQGQSHTE